MNQILLTDDNNIKKKKNKEININTSNTTRTNSKDIKKIIVFFSAVILVFGLAIGGIYGYRLLNKPNAEKIISKPIIELIEDETENPEEIIINVKSDVGISKIIYAWNDEEETVKELQGRTEEQTTIEIPYGENELKIRVIDMNGQEEPYTDTFYREKEVEENSDKIKISTEEKKNKLKIVVESELPLDTITYMWDGEEEVIVEAENEETMEISIDAKRGDNSITIIGKDIEGNTNTITKSVIGKLNPEIDVYKDGEKLCMKISHYLGFKKVEFSVNGKVYTYDENYSDYDDEKQELEYYFNLKEGENTVAIIAISNEETEATYAGKCNYTAE